MLNALTQIWIILWKDLLIDLRRKENILAMFFFALLTLLVFQFALGGGGQSRYRLTERAVRSLSDSGFAGEALRSVRQLQGTTFSTRAAFLEAINRLEAWQPSGNQRIQLLQAAKRTFLQESTPGLLWVMFLLAGVLGLGKSFSQEKENGCMDGLLLTPVSRGVIYLGKMISNVFFLVVLLVMVVPAFALLFQLPLGGVLLPLALILLAGVLGFAALGTLLGGVTSTLRGKEVLLPLLLFPLMAPVLIVVVQLTGAVLDGETLANHSKWVQLLVSADAIFLIFSYLVVEFSMET